MAIKLVNDVGAPLAVAAVNIASRTTFPAYHDYIVYGMSLLGYVGAWMGWGGDFVKQVGVSSLPLSADKLYERIRGGISQPAFKAVTRRVTQTPGPGFKGLRTY